MAKKKKPEAPAKIPGLPDMTPAQRQQITDIYRTLREHFSRKKKGKTTKRKDA